MNDGDWICSDANCGNINFARRSACYRCNKERPDGGKPVKKKLGTEIGKSAAEKSRGLFNADDWQCNKCANVNWARRQTCNVCNAPKFGEVEARTGYGGGYNERGVVEYRRREPSSDDEYDEFGRRKRKRKPENKSETQTKVGITEGAVFKNLTPTKSQMELNVDKTVMPAPQPNLSNKLNDDNTEYNKGSLSDGSVCDVSPFTVSAFRKYQTHGQSSSFPHNNSLPQYKTNGYQYRKRQASLGDKEHTGSSGYETCSKRAKHESSESPVFKSYKKPVMENRVTSTNDVVIKFPGSTPAETFQVTYTVEERVKAAAFAIAYNNCKISTDKFEAIFDKPAPDFKTIFAWRQRLLTTGCLVDTHLDQEKDTLEKPQIIPTLPLQNVQKVSFIKPNELPKIISQEKGKVVERLPNPDEIILSSDSEDEHFKSQTQSKSRQRCDSAETMVIPGLGGDIQNVGSAEDIRSLGRSQSSSTHRRTRSSSSDRSHNSDYEQCESKSTKSRTSIIRSTKSTRNSLPDTDSDSISYNSTDENFLSRKFGENRKIRRKHKKRAPVANIEKPPAYISNTAQPFSGYSTVKPPEQIAALAHGNIYTSNLRNMKPSQKMFSDIDACSTEYVPTRIGATAKKNYQQFKATVRRTGFWAKANGAAISSKRNINVKDSIPGLGEPPIPPKEIAKTSFPIPCYTTQVQKEISCGEDFTKDDFDCFKSNEQCLLFEKPPLKAKPNKESQPRPPQKAPEDTDRVFAIVQSNSSSKNGSIMDIFDGGQQGDNSPKTNNNLEKYDTMKKPFETQWDEDDDALYGDSETCTNSEQNLRRISSPPKIGRNKSPSPTTNMLYETNNGNDQSTPKEDQNILQQKKDMLLGLLKDFHNVSSENEFISPMKNNTPKKCSSRSSVESVASRIKKHPADSVVVNLFPRPEPIPADLSEEVIRLSESPKRISNDVKNKKINPSKQVKVLECVTIHSGVDKQSSNKKRSRIKDCEQSMNVTETFEDSDQLVDPELEREKEKHADIPLPKEQPPPKEQPSPKEQPPQPNPQVDLSNLLAGINTNTLLLALQNLQQLAQSSNNSLNTSQNNEEQNNEKKQQMETINLTNDEEWERESNRDESIERQLEKMDGDPSATPFLSDIFDPSPVMQPTTGAKLNINLKLPEQKSQAQNTEAQNQDLDEDAPVIGNFKSFALPKPIMLNRLKLAVKSNDKASKKSGDGKRRKKKKKSSATREEGGEEEDEDDESGDEADLSKYDLWGSDEEQDKSKAGGETANKSKEGESSKNVEADNGKTASPVSKSSKRSRSSSTSSSSSSSSSSSHSSANAPKNKFDDFNLNSERESSPKGRKSRSRSRSPRSRSSGGASGGGSGPTRRKSRDSRSAGETKVHESRDKEYTRDRERRERSRGSREDRKERRYSRDGNHYTASGRSRQR